MVIRVATFNVENLFARPAAMNFPDWSDGQDILDAHARLNSLLGHAIYSDQDKKDILELMVTYGLDKLRPNKDNYLILRKIRGKLLLHPRNKPAEVIAGGRADWVGWIELRKEAIADEAIKNTARVIAEVNPDIIVMVEVEDRLSLVNFHKQVLLPLMTDPDRKPYEHIMVIGGNDERGINVGIMSRYPIMNMASHVDDRTPAGDQVFTRDCPEYYLDLGNGTRMVILPNHFTSKGSDVEGNRRRVQSAAVKDIYTRLRQQDYSLVIIAGDFNDYSESGSLDSLVKNTDLRDAMALPAYNGYPGTYRHATAKEKFDYLLLSPGLVQKIRAVNVNRKGFYSPEKWECYENITARTKDRNQASDHHCLWADIDV